MKRILTLVFFGVSLLSIASTVRAQQHLTAEQNVSPPKLLAVLFYADWCGWCKELEPKLNKVKGDFRGQPILFTRFDLTNEFTNDQSARYAALLGLEKYYVDNKGDTGYMLLIDSKTKKVLGKISRQDSPQEMKAALTKALSGAA